MDIEKVAVGAKVTRRDVLRSTAYVAPVIMTMSCLPSFAASGSGQATTILGNSCGHSRKEMIRPRR